jgi:hypothetical protein
LKVRHSGRRFARVRVRHGGGIAEGVRHGGGTAAERRRGVTTMDSRWMKPRIRVKQWMKHVPLVLSKDSWSDQGADLRSDLKQLRPWLKQMSQVVSHGMSQVMSHGMSQVMSHVLSQVVSHGMSQVLSQVVSQVLSHVRSRNESCPQHLNKHVIPQQV